MIFFLSFPAGYFWGQALAYAIIMKDPIIWALFCFSSALAIAGFIGPWRRATP